MRRDEMLWALAWTLARWGSPVNAQLPPMLLCSS
jgi:hypothetical protein